jgi:hypothetical protein
MVREIASHLALLEDEFLQIRCAALSGFEGFVAGAATR